MTIVDKDGKPLDGGSTYRLHVPANAPVKLYWSATVYDRATHALIREMPWSSRSSNTPGLQKNADGSVDVYFGPKAPAGKESNWVPTNPSGQVRSALPLLWSRETVLRQDVEAAGHRAYCRSLSKESEAMKNLRLQICAGLPFLAQSETRDALAVS